MRTVAGRRAVLVALASLALGIGAVMPALAFFSGTTTASLTLAAAPDLTAPTLTRATVQKSQGGIAGFVRAGGGYRVYAEFADTGNPAAGVASADADATALTAGQGAAALATAGGPFTVGGQSYAHRSGALTVGAGTPAGAISPSVRATDAAGNAGGSSTFSATVDNTAPGGADIQTTNGGATAGRPEQGDTVTFTYTEQIDPESILAGWNGSATSAVVRIMDGGLGFDTLAAYDAGNAAQLPLSSGTVTLSSLLYASALVTFGATGTPSTMSQSGAAITVTLGTVSAAVSTGTAVTPGALAWNPSATAFDRAGNPSGTGGVSEGGTNDVDF